VVDSTDLELPAVVSRIAALVRSASSR
jgi:hypothetical protein